MNREFVTEATPLTSTEEAPTPVRPLRERVVTAFRRAGPTRTRTQAASDARRFYRMAG